MVWLESSHVNPDAQPRYSRDTLCQQPRYAIDSLAVRAYHRYHLNRLWQNANAMHTGPIRKVRFPCNPSARVFSLF
jgi:hypothetical protein